MGICSICGKNIAIPFRCSYCNLTFCAEHRLPEKHNCVRLPKRDLREKDAKGLLPTSSRVQTTGIPERNSGLTGYKAREKKSGKRTLFLLISIIIASAITSNLYIWDFRYSEGHKIGSSEGTVIGFQNGNATGFQHGYEKGNLTGFENGVIKGFNIGRQIGYEEGYELGHEVGYGKGYEEGYSTGHNIGYRIGNDTGYDDGYVQGVEEGAGRGFNIRDPTYKEAMRFVRNDKTDSMKYDAEDFNCQDFAAMFKSNAFKAGYRCYYVVIDFIADVGHAFVGFNTTDRGFIYIETQSDRKMSVEIGKPYWDRSIYETPDYDDTVIDIDKIP